MLARPVRAIPWLSALWDHSWISALDPDEHWEAHVPNKQSREVLSGHFVPVAPTPLDSPYLVAVSEDMLAELGQDKTASESEEFVQFFSGGIEVDGCASWATPYALSIAGREMYDNCPFKTGNGYGDGRAISIGEVIAPVSNERWELQLKGAGTTPFCRQFDGRAVLRSSVREFLVSEAMHHLGVPTTRALCLVASSTETVARAWFSGKTSKEEVLSVDDPRLSEYPLPVKKMIIAQLIQNTKNPDVMIEEPCAITTRCAPSFLRVGHVELFSRRLRRATEDDDVAHAQAQLEKIVEHALRREYAECNVAGSVQVRVLLMLRAFSQRLAHMTADWIRVGYCQGNFNSDNCLVGGRTMDYGPFGFVEKFQRNWTMWTGGGEHYSFMNQMHAGALNFRSFVSALQPLLDSEGRAEAEEIASEHETVAKAALDETWRRKLGFSRSSPEASALAEELLDVMEEAELDYTLTWRALRDIVQTEGNVDAAALRALEDAAYSPLVESSKSAMLSWVQRWLLALDTDAETAAETIRRASPRYIPREWMLVRAYEAAATREHGPLEELQSVFRAPYNEMEYSDVYARAPSYVYDGHGRGGVSFMT